MSKKINLKLPNKLSALLDAALDDFEVVKKYKNVTLNMSTWMRTDDDGKCEVCMAGSILYRHDRENVLKHVKDTTFNELDGEDSCSKNTFYKMHAVDQMRMGVLVEAADEMNVNIPGDDGIASMFYEYVSNFGKDQLHFDKNGYYPVKNYRKAAEFLRQFNL